MSFLERAMSGSSTRGGEYRRSPSRGQEPFLRRHFWPPSALGTIAIALVVSVLLGFLGAVYYTVSESKAVQLRDPDGPVDERPGANDPGLTVPAPKTTTTKPEFISLEALAKAVAPSVWSVSTLDEAGTPVEASAFVAGSFGEQSFLLTPLAVVRASTRSPAPPINVRNGGTSAVATLWTWQEERDLALLVIPRSAPPLQWAEDPTPALIGEKVFVAAPGAELAPGVVSGVSPDGILHNVFVEGARQGAPLLNRGGELLGMVSRDYNAGGIGTDRAFLAVTIRLACAKVLTCTDDKLGAPAVADPGSAPIPDGSATTTTTKKPTTTTTKKPTTTTTTRR